MAEDKKKIVTDEDVSKLLEELLGDTPGEASAKAAEPAAAPKHKPFSDEQPRPLLAQEIKPETPQAPQPEAPEETLSNDFLVEDEHYDPKLEATLEKAEKVRARAEAMATSAAVAIEKTRKAVEPVAQVLGHDEETRKKNLKTIWGYVGFAAALACGLVFLIYIYIAITLTGEGRYKEQLSATFKQMTGHELVIDGAVDFELFPRPRFIIGGAQLKNLPGALKPAMLTVKTIELKPSLPWLVLNTIKVRGAILHDPVIQLENFIGQAPNWQWYGKDSVWYDASGQAQAPKDAPASDFLQQAEAYLAGAEIVLINARVFYNSGAREKPIERAMQLETARVRANSLHGPFSASGTVIPAAGAATVGYRLNVADLAKANPKVIFSINLGSSAVTMEGEVVETGGRKAVQGKLKSSVAKATSIQGIALPQVFSGVLSEGTSLLQGDFYASREKIELQNVVVNSSQAKGTMNVGLLFGAPNVVSLAIQAETLDMDKLMGETQATGVEKKAVQLHNSLSETLFGLDLPRDIMVRMDTSIKAFTYKQKTIKNFRADVQVGSNSLILRAVDLEGLPGNTVIKAAAKPEGEQFKGRVSVRSDDFHQFLTWAGREPDLTQEQLKAFSFESAATMSEKGLALEELKATVAGSQITGKAVARAATEGIAADAEIAVDVLNVGASDVKQGDQTTPKVAQTERDFLAPLRQAEIWFETLNLVFAVKKVHYAKGELSGVKGTADFAGGVTAFKDVAFDSKFGKVALSGKVNHQLLKPEINVALELEKADINDLGELFGMDIQKQTNTRWSEQLVRVDKLASYTGNIDLKIGKVVYHDFLAEDVSTGLELTGERMMLKNFRAKTFQSRLKLEGYVVTNDQPMATFTFSLANADVYDTLYQLFGFGAVEGKANVTGGITVSGMSPYQWASTLQGNINFISRGIRIKGFSFITLVQRLPILQSVKEVQYWVPRALYAGETDFALASGGAKIVQGVFTMNDLVLRHGLLKNMKSTVSLSLPDWIVRFKADMSIGKNVIYPTTYTMESSIDQPVGRWDQKPIETTWEKVFYSGGFKQ